MADDEGPLKLHAELSVDLGPDALRILRRDVRAHYEELERLRARQELSAVDLAEEITTRLEVLLELLPTFSPAGRAAVVGAARYFVAAHDAVPDEDAGGLDDDVLVFNHAARAVGRADIQIRAESPSVGVTAP